MTGQEKYLTAAKKIADKLAAQVKPGDAENSPWPFCVQASDGVVHTEEKDGEIARASYTSNWTPPCRCLWH